MDLYPAQWNLVNLAQEQEQEQKQKQDSIRKQDSNRKPNLENEHNQHSLAQPLRPPNQSQTLYLDSEATDVTVVTFASDKQPALENTPALESTTGEEVAKRAAAQESNLGFKAVYEEDFEPLNFYELFPLGLYQNFSPTQNTSPTKPTRAEPIYKYVDFLRQK